MAEEFHGDLNGAVFWGAELRGARFRDVDLTGAEIAHAWVVDVQVDAYVERLVVNGVDVTAFVNERDPWFPLRTVLRVSDVAGMRSGWAALGEAWDALLERSRRLPEEATHRSVGGEWSLADTLRHLVFATDKWFVAPILGGGFRPFGLPNTGSADFPWPGLARTATPALDEVLAARAEQRAQLDDFLTDPELTRTVDVLENGPHAVRDCIATVLEEEFWHLRYADRDLTTLEAG